MKLRKACDCWMFYLPGPGGSYIGARNPGPCCRPAKHKRGGRRLCGPHVREFDEGSNRLAKPLPWGGRVVNRNG